MNLVNSASFKEAVGRVDLIKDECALDFGGLLRLVHSSTKSICKVWMLIYALLPHLRQYSVRRTLTSPRNKSSEP